MVADARGFWQAAQGFGREIACILRLLQVDLLGGLILGRLVDLVARGDEEIDLWMLSEGAVERLVPVIGVVARREVAVLLVALRRSLSLRSADLRSPTYMKVKSSGLPVLND